MAGSRASLRDRWVRGVQLEWDSEGVEVRRGCWEVDGRKDGRKE